VVGSQQMLKAGARCTLCPAGCGVLRVRVGPDSWRIDPPLEGAAGLCPRGAALGELLTHRDRILWPVCVEAAGRRQIDLSAAAAAIVQAAGERDLLVFLDGNVPCEQIAQAAAWCQAWPKARLCVVIEPADEQLLLGAEASGADYLADDALGDCDGFVLIGDVFAANPCCARGIFQRRAEDSRTPIVAIDPAAGTAAKFATHAVQAGVGQEALALAAVAAAAGVEARLPGAPSPAEMPSATAAGKAIARCGRLGVIVAAEYGRSTAWRQVGYLAGRLAAALGGGLACQTVGANALAALRCGRKLGTVPLVEALADRAAAWVVIGGDLLGMLGWMPQGILAAAAALSNRTTEAAEFVLPLALTAEMGGTVLLGGAREADVEPILPPPAGVPTGAEIVAQLARAAGIRPPQAASGPLATERLSVEPPAESGNGQAPAAPVLLFARQAAQAGCGALTAHGSWQQATQPLPELRISAADAAELAIRHLATVHVSAAGLSVDAKAQVCQLLPDGVVVLPEGTAAARRLAMCQVDEAAGQVVARPVTVEITP